MKKLNERQRALIDQRRIASVVTLSEDGMPHITPVWFLYEDDAFLIVINSASAKGSNVSRDDRMALMLDRREAGEETGFSVCGHAEILTGEDAAQVVRRVHAKYLTQQGVEDPAVGPVFAAIDDIALKLVPTRTISWDMPDIDRQAFGGQIRANGYARPVDP